MKKNIYLILCLITFSSYSQFEKGKFTVGFDYSQNYVFPEKKGNISPWSSIIGIPIVGYFLKDNILLGLNVDLQIAPKVDKQLNVKPGRVISLSPFFRLYKKTENNVVPFIQFSPKFGKRVDAEFELTNMFNEVVGTTTLKENIFGAKINTGASFKLSKKVIFDLSLYLDRVFTTTYFANPMIINGVRSDEKTHNSYSNTGITGGLKILL